MKSKKPYIIGITGGSGSGKTTFIKQIRTQFSEEQLCILSMDEYYHPKAEQDVDKEGIVNFDKPKSIDKKALIRDLNILMAGSPISIPKYNFNNKNAKPVMLNVEPAPIIIVEGLFVFHYKQLRKLLDLKIYFHAKENLKVIRRIKRDQVERNYPIEDVLYRYEKHVLPAYEKYIKPYMDKADIIINNNDGLNPISFSCFNFCSPVTFPEILACFIF